MDYISLLVHCSGSDAEIIASQLFENFALGIVEEGNQLIAYFDIKEISEKEIENALKLISTQFPFDYKFSLVEDENWNLLWESNYQPILVDDFCAVYAPFHLQSDECKHKITLSPKMSFGTGHHETTYLMIQMMNETDFLNRKVLDLGCGTGILSIVANKERAIEILAVDNDEQVIENIDENFQLNRTEEIKKVHGIISDIEQSEQFDIILANINKNVLLDAAEEISVHLNRNGTIIMSGFYKQDQEKIVSIYQALNFRLVSAKKKNQWACIKLAKNW